jgi:hypothetical protein
MFFLSKDMLADCYLRVALVLWFTTRILLSYISPDVLKLWGTLPRGRFWSSGGRVVCVMDIFILNKIYAQDKIYILVDTSFG